MANDDIRSLKKANYFKLKMAKRQFRKSIEVSKLLDRSERHNLPFILPRPLKVRRDAIKKKLARKALE